MTTFGAIAFVQNFEFIVKRTSILALTITVKILEFWPEGPGTGFLHKKRVPGILLLLLLFPPAPGQAARRFCRSWTLVSYKIAKHVNRAHFLNGSLFDRQISDVEDAIMRTSVRLTIIGVVSFVAIVVAAFSLYPTEAQAQDRYGAIAYSSSTGSLRILLRFWEPIRS